MGKYTLKRKGQTNDKDSHRRMIGVPCCFWVRSDRPNLVYDGNPRNRSRPSVHRNIVKIRRNIIGKRRNVVGKRRNVVGSRRNS